MGRLPLLGFLRIFMILRGTFTIRRGASKSTLQELEKGRFVQPVEDVLSLPPAASSQPVPTVV